MRLSWGAVLLPEAFDADVGREGTLRLHAAVADDDDQHARFAAVMDAFAWFAERVPGLLSEVDVGFHERGHLYSVDRFAVGRPYCSGTCLGGRPASASGPRCPRPGILGR